MRFLQNISLLLVGLVFSFAWSGCPPRNDGGDDPVTAAPDSRCDTCSSVVSCARFSCPAGKTPKCAACTTGQPIDAPEFKATFSNDNTSIENNGWTADASSLRCLLRKASNGRDELVLCGTNSTTTDAISLSMQAPNTTPLVAGVFDNSPGKGKSAVAFGGSNGKSYASKSLSPETITLTSFDNTKMTVAGSFTSIKVAVEGNFFKVVSGSFKNIKVTQPGAITGLGSTKSTLASKIGSTTYTADGTGTKLVTSAILDRFGPSKIAVNVAFATAKVLGFYIPIGANPGIINLNDDPLFGTSTRPVFTDGATSYGITTIPNANANTLVITSHNRLTRQIKGTFSYTLEKGATQLPVTNGVFDIYY